MRIRTLRRLLLALALCAVVAAPVPAMAQEKAEGGSDSTTLIYPDAMRLGKESLSKKRYRAAYLYFSQALSLNPASVEARSLAANALHLSRTSLPTPGGLTEFEKSLPDPPQELMTQIEEEIRKRYSTEGKEPEPEIPLPGEKPDDEEGGGERKDYVAPGDTPREPSTEKGEKPELVKPGLTTVFGIATRISLAPLITGRNSFFHALIHLPPFEGVRTLDEKVWYVEGGYEYCVGFAESGRYGLGTTDLVYRYDDNAYSQGYIKIAHGLMEGLELRMVLDTANLREGGQDIILTDFSTAPETIYIKQYDRRADIGNLLASVKWNFFRTISDWPEKDPETGLAGIFDLKIPLAQNPKNFTSSGQFDLACSLAASYYLGKLIFFPFIGHVSAGVAVPLGQRYFSHSVDLDPVFTFAIGAAMKFAGFGVLCAHIEGNTSAFTEFSPLSGLVLTTHIGVRLMLGHFFIESSIGLPLSEYSSKFVFNLHFGLHFMGKEQEEEIIT